MTELELILKRIAGIGILQHIVFWLISFRVVLEIFSSSSDPVKIDYIYTSVFLFTIMIPVYLNLYFFIPRLLSKRKYLLYSLSLLLLIVLFSTFNQLTFNRFIDYFFPGYYFISYYAFFDVVKFFVVFLFLTTLLKLSKAWFFVSETKQKLTEAEKQKIENELMALKSQVNPHFMFNNLNNIYSLSLKNSEKTPEA
ncbi:MAG: histidine kinase, partial [Bacteroidota bacterium]